MLEDLRLDRYLRKNRTIFKKIKKLKQTLEPGDNISEYYRNLRTQAIYSVRNLIGGDISEHDIEYAVHKLVQNYDRDVDDASGEVEILLACGLLDKACS